MEQVDPYREVGMIQAGPAATAAEPVKKKRVRKPARRRDMPKVEWNVKRLAVADGYKTARELGFAAGIYPASIEPIWDGTALQVAVKTMEKLCKVLRVSVGELFVYTPPEEQTRRG